MFSMKSYTLPILQVFSTLLTEEEVLNIISNRKDRVR